jgi:mRNA interferase RelE/StbE
VTYSIVLASSAQRNINALPPKVSDAVLEFIYSALAENPYRVGKLLHDRWKGHHSARRSSYRIIYQIIDETVTVTVVKVAYRADIYRQ